MNNALLRHLVATTVYRLRKVRDHTPPAFASYTAGVKTRSPQAAAIEFGVVSP